MSEDTGSVVTVDGRIEPDQLGVTLPHEHVFADWVADKFSEPGSAVERKLAREPIKLETLWYVQHNQSSHLDNLRLDSFEDACDELDRYRQAGGDSIIDVTPKNVGGDPDRVRAVSQETGVQIVHGTAFYTRSSHPDRINEMNREDVAEEFTRDIRDGIGDTSVRAGIIGEIGVTDTAEDRGDLDNEFHEEELTILRGGVDAALRTGASITIHPPFRRSAEWPTSRRCVELLDLIEDEGLPADRVVFCHRDQSKWLHQDLKYQKELAERGAYVEFDLFGHKDGPLPSLGDARPSDTDRIQWIQEMLSEGYTERLLLSHDVYLKYSLTKYGGGGYSYLLDNVLPVLPAFGVSEAQIQMIVEENPKRVLTFEEPQ